MANIRYVVVDDAALRKALAQAPEFTRELYSALYSSVRSGHTATVDAALSQVLGRPPIQFAQFARDYADSWR